MSAYRIVWEDEAKAREIELFVDYSLVSGEVQVDAIRPEKVTFYNVDTKQSIRSIGVHTKTGRRLLTEQYLATRDGISLEEEIRIQLEQRDENLAAEVNS
jgi:hypothetical protein